MGLSRSTSIITVTGYLGLLNGVQRYLLPLALVHYGWSIRDYSTVYVIQAFAMSLPLILGGFSTDLKGRKSTIVISFFSFTIGAMIFAFVISGASLIYLIVAQVITTVSFGISRMALSIQMADETTEGQERTSSLGLQAGIRNLLGFIGPVSFGLILDNVNLKFFNLVNFQVGFLILAVLGILGVLIALILPATDLQLLTMNRSIHLHDLTEDERKMQYAFGIEEAIIGFTSGLIVPFIDYYILTNFAPTNFEWGLLTGIGNISIALGSIFAGFFAENFGKSKFVLLSNFLVPFLALGIALGSSFGLVSVFYIARIATANLIQPVYEAWYYTLISENLRGRTMSFIQTGRRLSRAGGTILGPVAFTALGSLSFPIGCLFYPLAMLIPFVQEKRLGSDKSSITESAENITI